MANVNSSFWLHVDQDGASNHGKLNREKDAQLACDTYYALLISQL